MVVVIRLKTVIGVVEKMVMMSGRKRGKQMNEDIVRAREVLHNIKSHDFESCGNYKLEQREAAKVTDILEKFIVNLGGKLFKEEGYTLDKIADKMGIKDDSPIRPLRKFGGDEE